MLTEKQEQVLSDLYEIHHERLGWLSQLDELLHLSDDEKAWLSWRDDQQALVDKKLKSWEKEIADNCGWDIYNTEDDNTKLALINQRISSIEKEADGKTGDEAYIFLGMSELPKLVKLRHKVRGRLIHVVFDEALNECPEWLICQAREVPLSDIVEHLPRSGFIPCPFHAEKTPSFHVKKWGYCYGCGAWCDSIKWCMTQRSMTFVEAVQYLSSIR